MADNTTLNPGASGDAVVTREISHAGDTAKLQGVFAMGISGTEGAYTAAAIGGDATNGLDVDVTRLPPLVAGTANIGDVDILTIAPGDNNIGNVDVVTLPALPAGTNNIGDVDVLTLPALPAGTNNIGDVDILTIAAGDNNIGNVDVVTLPALPAGTNNIGDVDVLSIIPGSGATNLGKAEDAVHASGDVGVMSLAVRRDADTTLAGTDGDYAPLQVNAAGSLKVAITAGAGSGGTASADDADFTAGTTQGTPVMGVFESSPTSVTDGDLGTVGITATRAMKVHVASGGVTAVAEDAASAGGEEGVMVLAVRRDTPSSGVGADGDFAALSVDSNGALRVSGAGGGTQYNEDVAHVSGDTGTLALAVRRDTAASGASADGDYASLNVNASGRLYTSTTVDAALPAGTNNIGDVDVLTLPALPAGTNNIGDVDVLTLPALPAGTNNIGDVDILSIAAGDNNIGNVDVVTLPALPAGTNNIGDVDVLTLPGSAHDAAISGNPVRIAGRAATADYTAVAAGDTADLLASTLGKLVNLPFALPGASKSYASPSAVTDTADDVAFSAIASTRTYITGVQVFNGHDTVGTEVVIKDGTTVLWRGWAEQTGGGCSATFNPPLRGTVNTAVNVANITTGSATYFNLQGYSATE